MELKLLTKGKDKITFLLKGVDISYANTLRRIMMAEVPTLAIEDVEFKANNSILYDEIVAHRLGLVPIKTDLKSYNFVEECKCKGKGCGHCQLKLTLKTKGVGYVYAGDMKSKDPNCKPVYPKTPISKIIDKQEMQFEATAILGVGKEHAKWSPGLVFYKYNPIVKINKNPDNAEEIEAKCPARVFDLKKDKLSVNAKNESACILCNECVELSNDQIELQNSDEFIFTVESWGQLDPKEMVVKAFEIYNKQIDEFTKQLK
jgi:DNA-directed RNA polymerase subunit D